MYPFLGPVFTGDFHFPAGAVGAVGCGFGFLVSCGTERLHVGVDIASVHLLLYVCRVVPVDLLYEGFVGLVFFEEGAEGAPRDVGGNSSAPHISKVPVVVLVDAPRADDAGV